ncbi:hypothetical protein MIND_01202800 [Mycena indigotica]|uniref:Uncharacterized protein n=1 Tax=Mycena indigotica TaxID=2126181 RepID=A0A8H6VYQ8_9AGAR|nr:uncharacterized protein MIND_01202800 [Mycena indigotica]KAF7293034.1 hypothetical protein MIND_01202800 [Mycena indigotica]
MRKPQRQSSTKYMTSVHHELGNLDSTLCNHIFLPPTTMNSSERMASLLADSLENFLKRRGNILEEARTHLEWSWGLDYRDLEQHLEQFSNETLAERLLTDERVIVIPHIHDLHHLSFRDFKRKRAFVRLRPILEAYSGDQTFSYFVLPLDSTDSILPHRLELATPPHIVLIRTGAKLMRAYGDEPVGDDLLGQQLVARVRKASETRKDRRFGFGPLQLSIILRLYSTWTYVDPVPPGFKAGLVDYAQVDKKVIQTPYSPQYSPAHVAKYDPEPQRRVTARELRQDFNAKKEPLADADDSGSEIEDDSNPAWAKDVQQWAQVVSQTAERDERILINDITPDNRLEGSRTIASVDLARPDYRVRFRRRSMGP